MDVDLSRSEYDILLELTDISSSLHLYSRLVDDISVIMQGEFSDVRKVLETMATYYPKMPLNIQIRYGYSRFLDLHLYNKDALKTREREYTICRVLAYKEMTSFSYIPKCSNIHERYKHAVVTVSLYRIHTRNTLQADIDSHLSFLSKILKHRNQNSIEVKRRTMIFFKKKRFKTWNLKTRL